MKLFQDPQASLRWAGLCSRICAALARSRSCGGVRLARRAPPAQRWVQMQVLISGSMETGRRRGPRASKWLLQLGEAAGGAVRQHLPAVSEINLNTETLARTQSITLAGTQVSWLQMYARLRVAHLIRRAHAWTDNFFFFCFFPGARTLVWF